MRGLGCFGAAIGLNPVYWFLLFYVFHHRTLSAVAMAILGTAIGSATLQVSGMYCSRIRSAAELERDDRLNHGDLTPVTIESLSGIIPESLWRDLVSARAETGPLWRREPKAQGNEVYILVYQPKSTTAPWTPGSAFLGSVGLRVAIVRDNPLNANRPWSRFLLLHELAHVSSEGVALQVNRWRTLLILVYSLMTVILLATPSAHLWATGALILSFVLTLVTFLQFERLCESYADASAFVALSTPADRERVLTLMRLEVAGARKAFGDNHFHTRLWRARIAALKRKRQPSTFNPTGGTIFDPSALPFALACFAAVILAWWSTPAATWALWSYAIWCVACQIIAVILFLVARHTDSKVRIALNKRIQETSIESTIKIAKMGQGTIATGAPSKD